jgi:hypothetical protein
LQLHQFRQDTPGPARRGRENSGFAEPSACVAHTVEVQRQRLQRRIGYHANAIKKNTGFTRYSLYASRLHFYRYSARFPQSRFFFRRAGHSIL